MSSDMKHYHDEEFDPYSFVQSYWCNENYLLLSECLEFPVKHIHETLFSGKIKGETLLDISSGPSVYQYLPAANFFKNIIVAEASECTIKEFQRWLNKEEGISDWSYASKFACQLEGNSEEWQKKEDKVRRLINQVIKWDVRTSRPTAIPQVDCIFIVWMLHNLCKTKKEYQNSLKNVASTLKLGGYLLLFSAINMTYYMGGKHKFFMLAVDEPFIKETVINTGFVIEKQDVLPSKKGTDLAYYDSVSFILARKEKEV